MSRAMGTSHYGPFVHDALHWRLLVLCFITHILYHLRDNRKNIIGILTSESGELFLRFFKQYLNKLITQHLLKDVERKNADVPDDFLVNHISGSFVEMVQWWLKNNMKQSPEELAEYFLSVIIPII